MDEIWVGWGSVRIILEAKEIACRRCSIYIYVTETAIEAVEIIQ